MSPWSEALEELIAGMEDIEVRVYTFRKPYDPEQRGSLAERPLLVLGALEVLFFATRLRPRLFRESPYFCRLFETDPDVAPGLFCPPRELRTGTASRRWTPRARSCLRLKN